MNRRIKSNLDFRLMTISYKFRDFFQSRMNILKEVGIKRGDYILDYGCGSGSYILPLIELVGNEGKIYALDAHPIAIQMIQKIVLKKQLKNVEIIHSNCKTGLPDNSIDVVLLYDVLHELNKPNEVLEEIHRVLISNGILSVSDHHMKENEIISKVTSRGLFKLLKKGEKNI